MFRNPPKGFASGKNVHVINELHVLYRYITEEIRYIKLVRCNERAVCFFLLRYCCKLNGQYGYGLFNM